MSAITTRKMTVAEYLAWGERPENAELSTELVDGEVIEMPPAGRKHGIICSRIGRLVDEYFDLNGPGFVAGNDSGLIVAIDSVRGVDVAAFLGDPDEDDDVGYGVRMPVLCVEVVSPSDRPSQLQKCVTQYHAAGVPLVWVVQPKDQAVMVHRKGQTVEYLEGDAELTGGPELPGFACRVSAFFTRAQRAQP